MSLSVLDIYKIGIGPSSSHTMGPMNAARYFVLDLRSRGLLHRTARVCVHLYGSLALTGRGRSSIPAGSRGRHSRHAGARCHHADSELDSRK